MRQNCAKVPGHGPKMLKDSDRFNVGMRTLREPVPYLILPTDVQFMTRFVPTEAIMGNKRKKLRGRVQKVIKAVSPNQPEKAEIDIQGADDLYKEIRIENEMTDEHGETVKLKEGAEVDVIVEADSSATLKKPA